MKKDKLFLACRIILAFLYIAIIVVFFLSGIHRGYHGILPGTAGVGVSLFILFVFTAIQAVCYYVSMRLGKYKTDISLLLIIISVFKMSIATFFYWVLDNYMYDIVWLDIAENGWAMMYVGAIYFGLTVIAFVFEIIGAVRLIKASKQQAVQIIDIQ